MAYNDAAAEQAGKAALRAECRRALGAMQPAALAAADAAIWERLAALEEYRAAQTVFCYVSVGREADTRRLMEDVWRRGRRLCVPRCYGGGLMQAHELAVPEGLAAGRMGLLEPDAAAPLVAPEDIDLVVVPCLACDEQGWRLGQGGGYYDRWLPGCAAPRLCLCREELVLQALPRGPLDVRMDVVVTQRRLLRF